MIWVKARTRHTRLHCMPLVGHVLLLLLDNPGLCTRLIHVCLHTRHRLARCIGQMRPPPLIRLHRRPDSDQHSVQHSVPRLAAHLCRRAVQTLGQHWVMWLGGFLPHPPRRPLFRIQACPPSTRLVHRLPIQSLPLHETPFRA